MKQPKLSWSLMQRGNRWYFRYKRDQYSTGLEATPQNIPAVERMANELIEKERRGFELARGLRRVTIGEAWERFLEEKEPSVQKKTMTAYRSAYKVFVSNPTMPLNSVNVKNMVKATVKARPDIKGGWDAYRRGLQTFLTWCTKQEWLPDGFTISGLTPKVPRKRIKVFTHRELQDVITYFDERDPDMADLIRVMWMTGLRIHEALGLTFDDVAYDASGGVELHVTSKDGHRPETAPLTEAGAAVIERLRKRRALAKRVIIDAIGRRCVRDQPQGRKVFPWDAENDSRLRIRFKDALKAMGHAIDGRALHEIRKTFISDMARVGVDLRTSAKLARCGIQVMMNHYTQIDSTEARRALAALEAARSGSDR